MRLIAFLFLQLASMAVAYCATSQDKKVSADQLYTQVTRLVPQMEQTRDSVTYYQLLYKSFSLALVCDSIDALPNKKENPCHDTASSCSSCYEHRDSTSLTVV